MSRIVRRARSEAGAATLITLVLAGLVLFLGVGAAAGAQVLVAGRRAAAAADLAALAGAAAAQRHEPPCPAAADMAGANGAVLEACRVDGQTVMVTVRHELAWPRPLAVLLGEVAGGQGRAGVPAEARAGPR